MNDFLLGTNYWASNAGVDMWKDWQEDVIKEDLKILRENGVRYLRIFPNWRDFQPVQPLFAGSHEKKEYRMNPGDTEPENSYYLDPVMLERFHIFCRLAEDAGMKLIVGLITGWMSGRLFIPIALYDKNIYTDPTSLYFQQLFIKGFVTSMKAEESIYAWDLGNECNCMDAAKEREEACNWTAVITNAIRACDPDRQIVSGMHSLTLSGIWNIQDQAEMTDVLTTHPYPLWVEHCQKTPVNDFRTLLHATAQTQYYASVGGKPCLVEEIGTMGPMICNEENAAGFMRVNLWSNWANGAAGLLWWCANEQSQLEIAPYDWNMCERELGMLDIHRKPKPMLLEMKQFAEDLQKLDLELPKRNTDGVCILSQGQDHWGVAYMTYLLGKQAGLTLDFIYCEQTLPDSLLYFLPSICMANMSKKKYDLLKEKIFHGAALFISMDNGFMTEFEAFTGLRVITSHAAYEEGMTKLSRYEIPYKRTYQRGLFATRARVLAEDEHGNPLFTVSSYGKGKVFFLNFPLESMLLSMEKGLEQPFYEFYKIAAAGILEEHILSRINPYVGYTLHQGLDCIYAVFVNYSAQEQKLGLTLKSGWKAEMLLGRSEVLMPFDTAVCRLLYESE